MGYQTSYSLTVSPGASGDAIEDFVQGLGYPGMLDESVSWRNYALEYNGNGVWYPSDNVKWYEHDAFMVSLSLKFPNVLFTLSGEGEEAGDLWRSYYKNGKHQLCDAVITYPEYDESKMT